MPTLSLSFTSSCPQHPLMSLKGANEVHKTLEMKRKGEQVLFVIGVHCESLLLTHCEHIEEAEQWGYWGCTLIGCVSVTHAGLQGGAT